MCRYELLACLAEHEAADLRARVDGLKLGADLRVPELDAAVSRSTATHDQISLVRAPGNGLDGRLMAGKLEQGRAGLGLLRVPNLEPIIVASRCEEAVIEAPFEAADLLAMCLDATNTVLFDAQVSVQYTMVLTACTEYVLRIPGQSTDAAFMTFERPNQLLRIDIPDLHHSTQSASR